MQTIIILVQFIHVTLVVVVLLVLLVVMVASVCQRPNRKCREAKWLVMVCLRIEWNSIQSLAYPKMP